MAEKVRFFKGTQRAYNALSEKKSNFIYVITDTPAIYLGTTELTSITDLNDALSRLGAIESSLDGIDLSSEGSVRETIDDVLEYVEGITGDLDDLDTTADSSLVAAINENKGRIDSSAITISVAGTPTSGYLKTYVVSQGNTEVGKIDIPKDLVVQSGSLVEATAQNPINGSTSGTFLELVIANQTQHLYINLSTLIDIYTAQQNATQIQLSISNGVISASVVAGSITSTELASNSVVTAKITDKNVTKAKLEQNVQNTLSSADTHIASTSNPHNVTYTQVGAAAASHNHNASDINAGTLSSSRGGTGQTSLQDAANSLIKSLTTNSNDPVDGDYIIAQYPGGGSTTETYHRKSVTALYNYMKSKMTSDFAALSHGNHLPTYSTSNNDKVLKVVDGTPIWSDDKNTTYTFAEGTTNGAFSVTPSGGSASIIPIHGLGTAAYTASTDYATSGHSHVLTIATDSGTNALTLEANTKYKLTAGGSTFIFTTPAHQSLSNYATIGHTHTLTLATDTGTSQLTLAFGGKYKLTAGGSSYVFTMPANPDTNTTYGFTGGTNKFTVTPSSGDAYDVAVTPSITNNITGSGTSGYLAKFNGTNTLTNGPQLGSGGTFLRNDGSWATPENTKVNVVERGTTKAYLLGTTTSPTSTASAQTAVAETGVYFDTTTATLVATTFKGALTGTASGNLTSSSDLAWGKVIGRPTTLSGYGITDAASSSHTHDVTLATDDGTSTVTLAFGTKYKLTAGGKNVIFTMPSNPNTNTTYTFAEGSTNGAFSVTPSGGSATSVTIHGLGSAAYTDSSSYASSSHSHTLSLAEDTGTNALTLAFGKKYKLTAGGNSYIFTMPSATTNTTYTFAEGTTNGAFSVTPSGGSATSVSIHGLGSAAYTDSTAYAGSSHTHSTSIATSSGTNQLTLAFGTKYAITAGGTSYVFTMPSNPNTNTTYTFAEGTTNGAFSVTPSGGSASSIKIHGLGSAAYTDSTAYAAASHTHSYASSSHTHDISLATDTGISSVTLSHGGKYKLTAGGSSVIFTLPSDNNTNYYHTTGSWSGLTYTATANGGAGALAFTIPTGTSSTTVALGNHTHSNYLTSSSTLDATKLSGMIPTSSLPAYVDDVLEYSAKSSFPASPGDEGKGKIYVDTSTNLTYRWSGSDYVEISPSLALGETSSTAYRGDRGKTAYDHSQLTSGNPHGVTKSDVGLGSVGNFKAVSTVASQGLTDTEKSNARANIGAGTSSITIGTGSSNAAAGNHTHSTTLATDTGTSSVTLAFGGKYKLSTGGTSVIFTMPTAESYSHPTYTEASAAAVKVGRDALGHVVIGNALTYSDVGAASSGHTHTLSLASGGTSSIDLAASTTYTLTAGGNTYAFKTAPNTTYSSKTATSGGTDVSLVTTGEKYTWNNKSDLTIGTTSTTAAAGNHTHTMTLATDTGTSAITLASAGKYKLTAGGQSVIFTMPTIPTVSYPVTSVAGKTGAVTLTYSDVGAASSSHTHTASDVGAATSGHTHSTTLATDTGTSSITLASGGKYKLTAGGNSVIFTMPTSNNYSHPAYDAASAAAKKIGRDSSGHVVIGDSLTASDVGAATSGHTHDITLATDTGTSTVTLTSAGKYKLTAGGKSVIFTMPTIPTVNYPVTSVAGKTGAVTLSASDVGAASSSHTHTTSLATDTGTSTITLASAGKYKLTAGGTSVIFTMPTSNNYSHPTYTAADAAAVKVGRDSTGHVVIGSALSASDVGAATSGHTHSVSIAADSGTNALTLEANTKYKLTAGGSTFIFTTPAHQSLSGYSTTSHSHTVNIAADSGTNALTLAANTKYKLTAGGSTFIFTTPAHQSLSGYSTTSHTHTTSIATSTGTSQITLVHGGKYALTAGGTSYIFTMPSDNNDDTKNTAGSTDTSSKIFLIGATSQAANPQTYSHDTAYVGTDGCLYSDNTKVQKNITETAVTIATNSWNSSSQASATVSGVTSSSKIWISPAESTYDVFTAAGIRGISQTTNSITFQCSNTPTASVTINVAVAN